MKYGETGNMVNIPKSTWQPASMACTAETPPVSMQGFTVLLFQVKNAPEIEVVNNKSLWKIIWRKREKSNSIFQLPAEMSILRVFEFFEIRKFF